MVTFRDLCKLPFLTPKMVAEDGGRMVAVSETEIDRVMTLQTSGSTGQPKSIFYSYGDLAATESFFYHGMLNLISATDRVLVLLPYLQENSVGELLIRTLTAKGIHCAGHWPPRPVTTVVERILADRITSLVGLPQHLLELAHLLPPKTVQTMLLCSDYAPPQLRTRIRELCGATTFLHWGTTETGLGGAVECSVHNGCHVRESRLIIEIIDPDTGKNVPNGTPGEIVFSTIGHRGMPLFRYRTGDIASLTKAQCQCGGISARLQHIEGRAKNCMLTDGAVLSNRLLDDLLFAIDGLVDYRATLETDCQDQLNIDFLAAGDIGGLEGKIRNLLVNSPFFRHSIKSNGIAIGRICRQESFHPDHTLKRIIADHRKKESVCELSSTLL
jgi:phenylacetate-coenzyme A ligase PaaK-like adenylate-forming protein